MRLRYLLGFLMCCFAIGCGGDSTTSTDSTKTKRKPADPILAAIEKTGASAVLDKEGRETPIYLVDLTRSTSRDNVLEALGKADIDTPLRVVARNNRRLTGKGFKHLADLDHVKELELNGTRITDEDLVHLSNWRDLEVLDLSDTAITDAGLVHLKSPPLKKIALNRTAITNQGLRTLRAIRSLEVIHLASTKITYGGVSILSQFPELKEIDITGIEIDAFDQERVLRLLPRVRVLP